jgi:hypothetical protein
VIVGPLVRYGISDMVQALNTFETRLKMNTNLKVVLSAIALAALVAAPAVAKSRTQQHTGQTPTYSNNTADPDTFVRHEIQRDQDHYHLGD